MSFDKLLADLGDLAKAMPAAGSVVDTAAPGAAAAAAAAPAAGEGEPMSKAFAFTLADGTVVEAVDGTDLVKSLTARLEKAEGDLAKAMTDIPSVMTAQNNLIKSLTERVTELAGQGRGRKAVVSMAERPEPAQIETPLKKAESEGMGAVEFLAKAEGAFKAQKISGNELSQCETFLNKGMQIPAPLAAKVLG